MDKCLLFKAIACSLFRTFWNNLYNLLCGGKCFFIRVKNIFPTLVFTFLLYGELNQMMFLFRCLLLLVVFMFAWYLSLCLYPHLSKASWYGRIASLKISAETDNDESRDLIEIGSCLIIDVFYLIIFFMIRTLS